MKLDLDTKDFQRFSRELERFNDRTQKRLVQNAVTNALRVGLKDIRAAAPVGSKKSSAQQKYGYPKLRRAIQVKRIRERRTNKGAKITTDKAFWGYIIEKGSRYIPAMPWFDPAWNRVKSKVVRELDTKLLQQIEKEFKKIK